MKYIVIQVPMGPGLFREIPVIFPEELVHSDVAESLIAIVPNLKKGRAVSAGFLSSLDFGGSAHGKSDTLKLKSRPEDTRLIQMHDYLKGIKDRD